MPDPDLEPGWPVQAIHLPGIAHAGPALHVLVANIDGDPELEIVATSLAVGPLNAWNHDGTALHPWFGEILGAAYPAMGRLQKTDVAFRISAPVLNLVAGFFGIPSFVPSKIIAYDMLGSPLPGWPVTAVNYIAAPPALASFNGTSLDTVFIEEEDWQLHAYRANGTLPPGWPAWGDGGQEKHTPALADLDRDGDLEIVTASGWTSSGTYLLAYHHTGAPVSGFPVTFTGFADNFPAIGDVDRDGKDEIIVVGWSGGKPTILIFSSTGALKRTVQLAGSGSYGSAPALADLNGDWTPEIIVQTDGTVEAFYGNGTPYPGWPVSNGKCAGNSAPVVGDVDGDLQPEIVVTAHTCAQSITGDILVYDTNGMVHPRFPKTLNLGHGAVPAIADIDLDGRNEIVICGDFWNGYSGFYNKCWVFDLGGPKHGRIQWGQFGGNPSHTGWYRSRPP